MISELLEGAGSAPLGADLEEKFGEYLALLMKWNARTNLTAIRDAEGIVERHFVESILCARALPAGIHSLLDFGSGAGFPGIPIALILNDLGVTLAESQHKKAAFLREAVRVLGLTAVVHGGRAEELAGPFDCVTMRAVDDMAVALPAAAGLVAPGGWLAVMTTVGELDRVMAAAGGFSWREPVGLGGEFRVLALGRRRDQVERRS